MSLLGKHLWNDQTAQNGYDSNSEYRRHVFEQYKLFVEMADKVSGRRDIANTFFLTLNGLILSGGAAIVDRGLVFKSKWMLAFPYFILVLEVFFWWRLILSFKQLNGAKFQIVGELESRLPASPYGNAEWKHLLKEGKDRKVYWPLTHIETKIPCLFFFGYTAALIILLMS
jgi:hypothetical protein